LLLPRRAFSSGVDRAGPWAANYVRLESGDHYFVVDTDSDAVQKNLKPANPQAGQVKFPPWLYP
jgi:hypothetical protein